MKASNILKAAVALAASMSLHANANMIEVVQCVPTSKAIGDLEITGLCNATKANKELGLKLNERGCAIEQKTAYADGGDIFEQAAYTQYLSKGEQARQLPDCEIEEIGVFMVEL